MKRVLKKNQIVLTLLAVMIAVAGYLNYIDKEELAGSQMEAGITDISEEDILAENQVVSQAMEEGKTNSGEEVAAQTETQVGEASEANPEANPEPTDETAGAHPGEAIFTSGVTVAEFMTEVSLNKEQTRAKNKETLLTIVNSEAISEAQKQSAIDTMVQMTGIAELENATETVLKTKGFENAIVSITDGAVDVVIGKTSITDAERAQIEDIVKRKTDVSVENITLSLMNEESK